MLRRGRVVRQAHHEGSSGDAHHYELMARRRQIGDQLKAIRPRATTYENLLAFEWHRADARADG